MVAGVSKIHNRFGKKLNDSTGRYNTGQSSWEELKKVVKERDNWTCKKCGFKAQPNERWKLHAHHKRNLKDGGKNAVFNLVTLCSSCHEKIHD